MQKKWLTLLIVVATLVLGTAAVVAALKLRETQAPTAPASKPKAADELPPNPVEVTFSVSATAPSATITGPATGNVGQSLTYTGQASGQALSWVRLYWARTDADLTQSTSWTRIGTAQQNDFCNGTASCTATAAFTPASSGTYYVTVNASSTSGGSACSGNPSLSTKPIAGWSDCGANDLITLTVSAAAGTPTPSPSPSPSPTPGRASPTPSPSPTPSSGPGTSATPSPSPTPAARATASPKAKVQASPSPVAQETLPVAGINIPGVVAALGGIMLLLLGLALAL